MDAADERARSGDEAGCVRIGGSTRVVGLFGYPVAHTLSPAMHNALFRHLGLDYCYVAFSVPPDKLCDAVKGITAFTLAGVNITVPHKENIIPFLDEVSEEVAFIGAANTVRNDEGRLIGYNTDGRGFQRALCEAGIGVEGKRVLIVGTGGAARAIGYYVCREASAVYLHHLKSLRKAEALKGHLDGVRGNAFVADAGAMASREFFSGIDIVINATPLGLQPGDPSPVDTALLTGRHTVCDLIYHETPLLRAASSRGCTTLDGLGMLLWQGAFAFEIWTGVHPPVEVMREALRRGGKYLELA
ncbi:MAG: shikimate dehydrogenase [Nitrospirales bacterium]|nr:shikimate dehydrogenase [Nitrospirales bacterium]